MMRLGSVLGWSLLCCLAGSCDRGASGATATASTSAAATSTSASADPLRNRCDTGDAKACFQLAKSLSQGPKRDLRLAAELHQFGCDRGSLPACTALGDAYAERRGVKRDGAKARRLYERACKGGELLACARLGHAYLVGKLGARHDLSHALDLLQRSCDGGQQNGCYHLSAMYLGGYGVEENLARGKALLRTACEKGSGQACNGLGWRLERGEGVFSVNVFAALPAYRRGCQLGDGDCCTNLAFLHARGFGLPRDNARKISYDRRACDLGSPWGCANLGHAYYMGIGVEKNLLEAVRYSAQACRDLAGRACTNLGVMSKALNPDETVAAAIAGEVDTTVRYLERLCNDGERAACTLPQQVKAPKHPEDPRTKLQQDEKDCQAGAGDKCYAAGWLYEHGDFYVAPNAQLAAQLYEKACAAGDKKGCNNWGFALQRGFGVSLDYHQARDVFQNACESGDRYSCNNLAWTYANGLGVTADPDRAATLYDKSCKKNDGYACINLGNLQRRRAKPRMAEARKAYEGGCKAGNSTSCRRLAQMLRHGIGGARDEARAQRLLADACKRHNAPACGLYNAMVDERADAGPKLPAEGP